MKYLVSPAACIFQTPCVLLFYISSNPLSLCCVFGELLPIIHGTFSERLLYISTSTVYIQSLRSQVGVVLFLASCYGYLSFVLKG